MRACWAAWRYWDAARTAVSALRVPEVQWTRTWSSLRRVQSNFTCGHPLSWVLHSSIVGWPRNPASSSDAWPGATRPWSTTRPQGALLGASRERRVHLPGAGLGQRHPLNHWPTIVGRQPPDRLRARGDARRLAVTTSAPTARSGRTS